MRFLIVSDPARRDFFEYLLPALQSEGEVLLLWNYNEKESKSISNVAPGVRQLFWSHYPTPAHLLQQVRPDRVLFFQIIDLWQIPLIIACQHFKIASFFLEHGVGSSVEIVKERFKENPPWYKKIFYFLKKMFTSAGPFLRNRIFFFSAFAYLGKSSRWKYLRLLLYLKMYSPIEALSKLKFRERTPRYAIVFNRNNVKPFLLYNEIDAGSIITEGVPFFDKYFRMAAEDEPHVVFIDHPYLEQGILNWTPEFHEKVARALEKFAQQYRLKLIVKLHPTSKLENWLKYNLNPTYIVLKQTEDVMSEMLSARLILGYSSTLMNILIQCKKNIVLLGWHPHPAIFGDDISKTGLCHVSFSMDDLFSKLPHWAMHNLVQKYDDRYLDFLKEYNYPFDGKATQRVIQAILANEIP